MNKAPKISEEIQEIKYEPLLPIEKKLIRWSIITVIGLIILLYLLSRLII